MIFFNAPMAAAVAVAASEQAFRPAVAAAVVAVAPEQTFRPAVAAAVVAAPVVGAAALERAFEPASEVGTTPAMRYLLARPGMAARRQS